MNDITEKKRGDKMLKSLRTRLAFIIVLIMAVTLGVVSYINYHKVSVIVMGELSNAAANSAGYNARIIEKWLEGIVNEVNTLAENGEVRSGDPAGYVPALKRVLNKHNDFELVYCTDAEGNGAGSNDTTFNLSDRAYFKEAMQGK